VPLALSLSLTLMLPLYQDLVASTVWAAETPCALGGAPVSIEKWCARALYECVAQDKPQVLLALYLMFQHFALTLKYSASSLVAWNLRLAIDYSGSRLNAASSSRLLRPDFVEAIRVHVDRTLTGHPLYYTQEQDLQDETTPAHADLERTHADRLRACAAILGPVFHPDFSDS
jgi:hypothetical protein